MIMAIAVTVLWIGMFIWGFGFGCKRLLADLFPIGLILTICYYPLWFLHLYLTNPVFAFGSTTASDWGLIGLIAFTFFSSSLGSGYIIGKLYDKLYEEYAK